ncbi:TIGR02206 family membrane protein [Aquibacillus sediminis]|uniref:YwaF family protein n=1 Tax=Aquibacillus sediminis TaxID=2574734 RepID=UPI001107C7D7|nr:TIGR02206 family membrane protein [Aquibacillus sediminis]
MRLWFGEAVDQPFLLFSTSHIIMMLLYVVGIIVLFLTYKQIAARPNVYQTIRWTLLVVLVLSEASYQLWAILNGLWTFGDHMPLHLCGVASIIAILALWKPNRTLVQLAVFFGIVPALLAIITPDIPYDYQHFRFWKFFIHHIAISWASLFLILTSHYKATAKGLVTAYSLLVGYAIIVGTWINPTFGSNYLYLSEPAANTLLHYFGTGFAYYIKLGLVALGIFLFLLGVFSLLNHHNTNHRQP